MVSTLRCELLIGSARNGQFGGENTKPAVSRLRKDEQILVPEVISSVSYAPVQSEWMSLVWYVGAKRESNGCESHPWADPQPLPLRINQTEQHLCISNG